MARIAMITGTADTVTSNLVKVVGDRIDNYDVTGFSTIPEYVESYNRAEFYDKVVLLNKALHGNLEEAFESIHNVMSIKTKTADFEAVKLIYVVFSDTPSSNVTEFNRIFTSLNTAVYRAPVPSKGQAPIDMFVEACTIDPTDSAERFPDDNKKILSTETSSADTMAVGYNLGEHGETNFLTDEDLPPEDEDEDLPPDEDEPVIDPAQVQQVADSIEISMPAGEVAGDYLSIAFNPEDTSLFPVKLALQAVLKKKSVLIVDLTQEHAVMEVVKDEPAYASYTLGIDQAPYQTMGINFLSVSTLSKDEVDKALRLDTPNYNVVVYVLDADRAKYFSYSRHEGVSIDILVRPDDIPDFLDKFSTSKYAPANLVVAYSNNGHLLFNGDPVPAPEYFIDRVDWFRD